MNISQVENEIKTKTSVGLNIGFRPDATNLGLKKPDIIKLGMEILKIEKFALFSDIVSILLLGLLSLIKPMDYNIIDFDIAQ